MYELAKILTGILYFGGAIIFLIVTYYTIVLFIKVIQISYKSLKSFIKGE